MRQVLLMGAAVVVLAVIFSRGSGPERVDQALGAAGKFPTGSIVHFTSITRDPGGALTSRTELWVATFPPYARRSIRQGAHGPVIEHGAKGDEVTQFDPAGVVYVRTRAGATAKGTPATGSQRVKAYLRDGHVRDEGVVNVGGATIRRFAVAPQGGGTCSYDVQPHTFFGVSLTCTGLPTGSVSEQWDYLPRQGNVPLLSVVAQHPSARIDRASPGA